MKKALSPKNVSFFFVASDSLVKNIPIECKKGQRKMPPAEHNIYGSYISKEDKLYPILMDGKKCHMMLENKIRYSDTVIFHCRLDVSKEQFLTKLEALFNQPTEGSLIIFTGDGSKETGNWIIENAKSSKNAPDEIRFEDVTRIWKKRTSSQMHLLLIMDSNYSGHWIKKLQKIGEYTISIQASCRDNQKCFEDPKLGSYFIHNLFKVVMQKTSEHILDEIAGFQTPCFYGHFHDVYRIFGLKLKFDSWEDIRKALHQESHGNWPHILPPPKNSNSKLNLQHQAHSINWDKDLPHHTDPNGKKYEGSFDRHGKKEGFGVLYDKQFLVEYKGEFKNDKKNGNGSVYDHYGVKVFEGTFQNDVQIGFGQLYDQEGFKKIEGFCQDMKLIGEGFEFDRNENIVYRGTYKNDKRFGHGIEFYPNKVIKHEGNWGDGKLNGEVNDYTIDGSFLFQGTYRNGHRNGLGKMYHDNGLLKYEGPFFNGLFHGQGKVYSKLGDVIVEGQFIKGALDGPCTVFYVDGTEMWSGDFMNGKPIQMPAPKQTELKQYFNTVADLGNKPAVTNLGHKNSKEATRNNGFESRKSDAVKPKTSLTSRGRAQSVTKPNPAIKYGSKLPKLDSEMLLSKNEFIPPQPEPKKLEQDKQTNQKLPSSSRKNTGKVSDQFTKKTDAENSIQPQQNQNVIQINPTSEEHAYQENLFLAEELNLNDITAAIEEAIDKADEKERKIDKNHDFEHIYSQNAEFFEEVLSEKRLQSMQNLATHEPITALNVKVSPSEGFVKKRHPEVNKEDDLIRADLGKPPSLGMQNDSFGSPGSILKPQSTSFKSPPLKPIEDHLLSNLSKTSHGDSHNDNLRYGEFLRNNHQNDPDAKSDSKSGQSEPKSDRKSLQSVQKSDRKSSQPEPKKSKGAIQIPHVPIGNFQFAPLSYKDEYGITEENGLIEKIVKSKQTQHVRSKSVSTKMGVTRGSSRSSKTSAQTRQHIKQKSFVGTLTSHEGSVPEKVRFVI